MRWIVAFAVSLLLAGSPSQADPPEAEKTAEELDREALSITRHSVTANGKQLEYTATAGYFTLPDYEGKPRAKIFFIAYTLDGADPASRPLTFAFNGGPGSSSVWLHMGGLGPKRVDMGREGFDDTPPFKLVDNEFTWLEWTDLVFIDPVSTGYSRPAPGVSAKTFHGLQEDASAVGDFIRLWTTREARWASPKFLAGESYGTTRAAALSGYLQGEHGMYLTGITLVSPVLNFQTIRFGVGNDDPYWLYLPTYTATAYFHGKLEPRLQENLTRTLAEARAWASSEYLLALAKGDALGEAERDRIAGALARFTGLSKTFCLQSDLRIGISNFTKELRRSEGRTVGRLDSRFQGIDRLDIGANPEYDPSMSAIDGTYTAALNDYMRRTLGYKNDLPYEILTGRVYPWSYAQNENQYANVAETLRSAMSQNPSLRVMVASGYYDLATPFFAAEHTVSHMQLDPSLRPHIETHYYEAGHMMYIRHVDLEKFTRDVRGFYERALAGE